MYNTLIIITGMNSPLIRVERVTGMRWLCCGGLLLCMCIRKCWRKVTGGIPGELRPLQAAAAHTTFLWGAWGAKVQIVQSTSVLKLRFLEREDVLNICEHALSFRRHPHNYSCLSSPTPYMPPLSLICDERKNLKRPNRQRHCFSFKVISDGGSKLHSLSEVSNERSLLLRCSTSHSILGF